jgi:hypothetical protein
MSWVFGDFALDQERRQLLRAGMPLALEPKAYDLLSLLLARRPRALSKAQIREEVGPMGQPHEAVSVPIDGITSEVEGGAREQDLSALGETGELLEEGRGPRAGRELYHVNVGSRGLVEGGRQSRQRAIERPR